MSKPIVIALALTLGGCAELQLFKSAIPVIADKVVDGAYRVTCGLPYRTELCFLARHDIDAVAHKMFCKRRVP